MQALLGHGVYYSWLQHNLLQAQYFKVRVIRGGGFKIVSRHDPQGPSIVHYRV